MRLPRRIKHKSGRDGKLRCASHLKWIRGHECAVCGPHGSNFKIEAAHVRNGTDGSLAVKPSDNWAIPLCALHHRIQHDMGEPRFEAMYEIDMKAIAQALWKRSPHRRKAA